MRLSFTRDEVKVVSRADEDPSTRFGRGRLRANAALVACLITPGLLTWAWSRPTPVAPREMPPLVLEPQALEAQRERDRRAAEGAVDDDERARLYHEANVAQHEGGEPPGRARARSEALRQLASELGEEALAGVRARDLARAEQALWGALPAGERIAELGGFGETLQRYGLVHDGRQVGPRAVIRVLFKARWNTMHARPLTEAFSPIELQAYWGWLAIRGDAAPLERRLDGASHYARAGGRDAAEIRGVLLYREGHLDDARTAFEQAHGENPSFRLQNHILACTRAVLDEGDDAI